MDAPTVASSERSSSSDPLGGSASPASAHNGAQVDDDRPSKRARLTPGLEALPVQRSQLNYRSGMFLAPMVRIGTLTTRLLALEYGADLVWGPEIVDRAIIGARRTVSESSGVIEYTKTGPKSIWQTHPIEKSRLIYQIGSADKDLALEAARTVAGDVSGIDLNCGCPKSFSTSGGMGAALLKTPDKLCGILRHLVDNLPTMLISCKIRLLPSQEDTLDLVTKICATGISCLTVHCRTQSMRSSEPALLHRLREIVERVDALTGGRVPVVANGDCWGFEDVDRIRDLTGVTSVMSARGAEANVSCFKREGKLDVATEVMPLFVRIGLATDQNFGLAKYCINTMDMKSGRPQVGTLGDKSSRKSLKNQIAQTKTWEDLAKLYNIDDIDAVRATRVEDLLPLTQRINARAIEEGKLAAGMVDVEPKRVLSGEVGAVGVHASSADALTATA